MTDDSTKSSKKEKKISISEFYNEAQSWLSGLASARLTWPTPFPHSFHKRILPNGESQVLQELPGKVLVQIPLRRVADIYMQEVQQVPGKGIFSFLPRNLTEMIQDWWNKKSDFTADIKHVLQKSKDGYCWHRLDFDISEGPTPVWDSLVKFITSDNVDAMEAWIGALFDDSVLPQQYLYLFGGGDNGKSSIAKMIYEVFGGDKLTGAFIPQTNQSATNQFSWSSIVGKRLGLIDDLKSPDFVTSETFMSATGGMPVRIEDKGCRPYTYSPNAMFIITSNAKPKIESTTSDLRRALFVQFRDKKPGEWIGEDDGRDIVSQLRPELPHIIYRCFEKYKSLYNTALKRIPYKSHVIEEIAAENEGDFFDACQELLIPGEGCRVRRSDLTRTLRGEGYNWRDAKIGKFFEYLVRVHKAQLSGFKGIRYLHGFKLAKEPPTF